MFLYPIFHISYDVPTMLSYILSIQLLEYPIPAAAAARHKNRQVPISWKP